MTPDEYRLEQRLHELGYDEEEIAELDEDFDYESYVDDKVMKGEK